MTETIPGGAYQNPDGSWHDANGKPLPSSKVREAQARQDPPAETPVLPEPPPVPPVVPPGEAEEEPAAGKRGGRSKKS